MAKQQKKNTVVAKKAVADEVKTVRDWGWLTGTKGVVQAPKGAFYDKLDDLVDAKAKRYFKQAQAVAKLADEEVADTDTGSVEIERRLRKASHSLVATAIYRQKEVDGESTKSNSIVSLKAKKAKCEELLAKLETTED